MFTKNGSVSLSQWKCRSLIDDLFLRALLSRSQSSCESLEDLVRDIFNWRPRIKRITANWITEQHTSVVHWQKRRQPRRISNYVWVCVEEKRRSFSPIWVVKSKQEALPVKAHHLRPPQTHLQNLGPAFTFSDLFCRRVPETEPESGDWEYFHFNCNLQTLVD